MSTFTPYGYQASSCGYCKDAETGERSPQTSGSYGATSKQLTVEHYQKLIDRGWRRSGTYLYKPDTQRSCCPSHTMRLRAADFEPSRDQRQALNKWNKFVLGETYEKELAKLKPPQTKQEKAQARNTSTFSLLSSIHASEASHLPPLSTAMSTSTPIPTPAPTPTSTTTPNPTTTPTPAHTFTVTLEPPTFTPEKYALYALYQSQIHHDAPSAITPAGFTRFLCTSPLVPSAQPNPSSDTPQPLGTYHQLYRLDGQLIALSVLDLLPHAVSGVYFLYDPKYAKYSMGKLSALREAAMAEEGGYEWYYMGFYIHDCVKMRYKGEYRPQMVLDQGRGERNGDGEGGQEGEGEGKWVDLGECVERGRRRGGGLVFPGEDEETETNADTEENTTTNTEDEYATPLLAQSSGQSLFTLSFPGLTPLPTLLSTLDLDATKIILPSCTPSSSLPGRGGSAVKPPPRTVPASRLVGWAEGSYLDSSSLKGVVAELAGCLGTEVAGEMGVDFSG